MQIGAITSTTVNAVAITKVDYWLCFNEWPEYDFRGDYFVQI